MEEEFIKYCKRGDLKNAKLLYERKNVDIHACCDKAFEYACSNGRLHVAKWLHGLGIHTCNNLAFKFACRFGHLKTAKWLYSLSADIHTSNDCAFRLACKHGHLETAKWLYSLGANIHAEIDVAFRWACWNRHLDVAKWLYSLGANIHESNDEAFRLARKFNNLEIAKWLSTLSDFYKFEINNNKITGYKILYLKDVVNKNKIVVKTNICYSCNKNKKTVNICKYDHMFCFNCVDKRCPLCFDEIKIKDLF